MKVGETKSAVTHGFHHAFEIISGEYDRSHFDFAFTKDTIKTVVCKVQEPCVRHQRKYGSNIICMIAMYSTRTVRVRVQLRSCTFEILSYENKRCTVQYSTYIRRYFRTIEYGNRYSTNNFVVVHVHVYNYFRCFRTKILCVLYTCTVHVHVV